MTEFKIKISNWEATFNSYLDNELQCTNKLNLILEIKNNLTKLIGNQRKDDILFYKSIIDNSYYYYTKSLNVRKIKFIKDLSFIYTKLDDRKTFTELNKSNFSTLLKDFTKLVDDAKTAKENNTVLSWVKDDTIISLQETEKELDDIMKYHVNLMNSFYKSIENEANFYCGNKNQTPSVKIPLPHQSVHRNSSQTIVSVINSPDTYNI
jgi:hypothetical protein